jgi:phage baseplate assembly protein gpV
VKTGVPIPLAHFYARYGRPEPREGERVLRYDDSNLFQYHMQHGVLTVNEVRARLQLPPVPWGDVPTRPQETGLSTAPGPSREELAAGEAAAEGEEQRHERERRGQ